MTGVLVDTHALIWYLLEPARLSAAARAALDGAAASGETITFSAITIVEIRYLVEKGRVPSDTLDRVREHVEDPTRNLRVYPLDAVVAISVGAIARDQVPDMPDRIIAATALALGLPLVTRDHKIRAADVTTIW